MNTGSPNSAFTTEYEFTLVEIWPDNRNPNDAINSMVPLYQTTTTNTALIYGPAEPQLVPGRKYVCRLKAYDTQGRDLFKNNGYSQILTFTFGRECLPPININHSIKTHEKVKVNWQTLPGQTQYRLSYSEQNADGSWSGWYHNDGILPYSTIKGLKAEHTYRYKLMATCGAIESEYSGIKKFSTPKKKEKEVECGKDLGIPKIDGSPPLQSLKPGDMINVGGFDARILEAEGSGGIFTGKCVVNVVTFGFWVQSEFKNISINQSMQVTAGEINAVKGALRLLDVDAFLDSLGVGMGDDDEIISPDDSIFVYNPGDTIIVTLGGDDFILTGDTTIITAGGDTIITDFGFIPPIIIVNGDTIIVDNDVVDLDNLGGGTDDVAGGQSDTVVYALNYVEFIEYEDPTGIKFGFDAFPPGIPQYLNEYKKEKVLEQEYIVPWQSAEANGKPANINMLIDTELPDSINTRLKVVMNNMPLNFTASSDGDTIRILNLSGQGHKNKELITTYYINDEEKEIPIGYLNLISYERQNFNLVIVPIDGKFDYTDYALKTYLNKVYSPALTSWEVTKANGLAVEYDEGGANGLNTTRSFFSSFNKEMKAVIEAMKDRGDYNKKNYYLFVMDKAENENLNGLMPFNSHFGFLFTGDEPGETRLFRTIAHELGHGVFKLKHNFDDKGTEKRSTQNLMDYTTTPETATVLRKFQWDEIIDPRAIAFGWSEELYSEETEEVSIESVFINELDISYENNRPVVKVTITGRIIDLSSAPSILTSEFPTWMQNYADKHLNSNDVDLSNIKFGNYGYLNNAKESKVIFDMNFNVVNSMREVKEGDHLIVLCNIEPVDFGDADGITVSKGGLVMYVDRQIPNGPTLFTIMHELFTHSLSHKGGNVEDHEGNSFYLTNSSPLGILWSNYVTNEQRKRVIKNYYNNVLNQGKTFNPFDGYQKDPGNKYPYRTVYYYFDNELKEYDITHWGIDWDLIKKKIDENW